MNPLYKKPIPGNILKTASLVSVNHFSDNKITEKSKKIKNGQIILFLESIGMNTFIFLYDNKKYIYKNSFFGNQHFPFTIIY